MALQTYVVRVSYQRRGEAPEAKLFNVEASSVRVALSRGLDLARFRGVRDNEFRGVLLEEAP